MGLEKRSKLGDGDGLTPGITPNQCFVWASSIFKYDPRADPRANGQIHRQFYEVENLEFEDVTNQE